MFAMTKTDRMQDVIKTMMLTGIFHNISDATPEIVAVTRAAAALVTHENPLKAAIAGFISQAIDEPLLANVLARAVEGGFAGATQAAATMVIAAATVNAVSQAMEQQESNSAKNDEKNKSTDKEATRESNSITSTTSSSSDARDVFKSSLNANLKSGNISQRISTPEFNGVSLYAKRPVGNALKDFTVGYSFQYEGNAKSVGVGRSEVFTAGVMVEDSITMSVFGDFGGSHFQVTPKITTLFEDDCQKVIQKVSTNRSHFTTTTEAHYNLAPNCVITPQAAVTLLSFYPPVRAARVAATAVKSPAAVAFVANTSKKVLDGAKKVEAAAEVLFHQKVLSAVPKL